MTPSQVVVVGAGISGLACAHALIEHGVRDLLVLEASDRAGGPIETLRIGDYLVERGPSTIRRTADLDWLFARADLEILEGRRGAPYVVHQGRLLRLPPAPGALLAGRWLPRLALLGALLEPFRGPQPGTPTVEQWVAQRLGPVVARHVADLLTLGTFGAPANRIGFESGFPELADALGEVGGRLSRLALRRLLRRPRGTPTPGGLISAPGGLESLPQQLAKRLGSRLQLRSAVTRIERHEAGFELRVGPDGDRRLSTRQLVLTLPPAQAASMLALPVDASGLADYTTTPQTLATFALDEPECAARWSGFGFLVPTREHLPLLGALFANRVIAERAPQGSLLLTVFVGPPLRDSSEGGLVRDLGPLIKRLLGSLQEPRLIDVARHPAGIPLYDPEHRRRTLAVREALAELGGIQLAGWAYDGAGVGSAAASGRAAAAAIAARL